MTNNNSILDRIINQQRDSELAEFSPVEIKNGLFSHLKQREADVLNKRFGLNGEQKLTLEEIGKLYTVTRERVRQIEIFAIKKLLASQKKEPRFTTPIIAIRRILELSGELREQDDLLHEIFALVQSGSGDTKEQKFKQYKKAIINFFIFGLNRLWHSEFTKIEPDDNFRLGWRLAGTSLNLLRELIKTVEDIIKKKGRPISTNDLMRQLQQTSFWSANKDKYLDKMILDSNKLKDLIMAQLRLSSHLATNIFDEWGIANWSLIKPRRMTDKIYLVLKKHKKPMHFRDIAKAINHAGFDHKKAYPPTIHNELILDKRYVLIGRGIYALSEWGYYPGTVSDVIRRILQESEHALTRKEIVKKVLKQRLVNQATINLALTNKKQFLKQADGSYSLV